VVWDHPDNGNSTAAAYAALPAIRVQRLSAPVNGGFNTKLDINVTWTLPRGGEDFKQNRPLQTGSSTRVVRQLSRAWRSNRDIHRNKHRRAARAFVCVAHETVPSQCSNSGTARHSLPTGFSPIPRAVQLLSPLCPWFPERASARTRF
jgi:hypothetical protein